MFTAATTFVWLFGGFVYLVLSRLYMTLQLPTIMLGLMFLMAAGTAVAAIAYASRLDEQAARDADREDDALASRRARRLIAFRPRQR